MATFPIQFAERVPPPVGPSVRAGAGPQLDTRAVPTGEAAQWRAVAGLGQALAGVGTEFLKKFQVAAERIQGAEDAIAVSEGKRKYDELMGLTHQSIAVAPDETAAATIWQKAQADASNIPAGYGRPKVRNALTVHINNTIGQHGVKVATATLSIKKSNLLAQAEIDWQAKLENGDVPGAQKLMAMMALLDPANRAVYEQQGKDAPVDSVMAQAAVMAGQDPDTALGMLARLHESKLTVAQAARRDSLTAHALEVQRRNKGQREAIIQANRFDLYVMLEKDELITDELIIEKLGKGKEATAFMRVRNNMRLKRQAGRIEAFEKGNPVTEAKLDMAIDLQPDAISAQDIWDAVETKGLGVKAAARLVGRLKTAQAKKKPFDQYMLSRLAAAGNAGVFGKLSSPENASQLVMAHSQFVDFQKTGPTDAEQIKFFDQLIIEEHGFWSNPFGERVISGIDSDELPGPGNKPIDVELALPDGTTGNIEVRFATRHTIGGQLFMAVGRTNGIIQWLPLEAGAKPGAFDPKTNMPYIVKDDKEAIALPQGALYKGPNGILYRKDWKNP